MKVDIEFYVSPTGSSAAFTLRLEDVYIPHAAQGKIYLSKEDNELEYDSQFERILLNDILKIRGVVRIDVLSRAELTVDCTDMMVDEDNEPIFGDNGWFLIHNSIVEAINDYYISTLGTTINIVFTDDYPQDFELGDAALSDSDKEDIEKHDETLGQ